MEQISNITNLQILAGILSLLIGYLVSKKLIFSRLISDKKCQHLVFGSAACVFILWMFRTGIYDGLVVHFLWLSALPLLLGFRWAVFSASLALVGVTIFGQEHLHMLGVNFLLGVLAPISLTYGVYSLTFYKLPRHLFVYIFLCAFIPGALSIGLKMLAMSGYFYLDGMYSWQVIEDNYLVLSTLMLFPEAMFNGMTITLLIIYKPEWVYTFYDKLYLDDK
ncbi:energy-coupling factor ABC transporter permease [Paraglaciecola arctica]|uniref:energy-coupling factor ABC transporter permease n=1 Tax=Paraglaciecola arctica TaxID=1128911 RepID=UPI0002E06F64|nr:energy-coupling factor ABC transporter permease [Paraglaciecola arctica]